ncbi:MAG: response regulator [Solirubrobacteraceae bacterium]
MITTLLVVDDHQGFRSFVSTLLDGERFSIAGVAEDGETALDAVNLLRPDLVLLDIQLPGMGGFEVAERLASGAYRPGVVLTSTREATDFGARLRNAPVLGFVPKNELSVEAISQLVEHPISRLVAERADGG